MSTTANTRAPDFTDQLRIWVDGAVYSDPSMARVSAVDHGLVVGDGVFEALKVTADGPFTLQRHLDRLTRSSRAIGLPDPDHGLIREAIAAVLEDRTFVDGKVRITYTGGPGPLGSHAASGPPTLVVAADSRILARPSAAVVTAPWTRNEKGALAGVKSTSYGENVRSLAYAHERDASEAILLNTASHVCEGTGSNIFFVYGSEIITPPLSAGPLAGITRDLVLQWCDVTEANLSLTEAQAADEIFLTSSLRDVQAVHRWDEVQFGADPVGPRTRQVVELFAHRSAETPEP